MLLQIKDVYEQVEHSERMDLFFDADLEVDTRNVGDFITELSEQITPLNILREVDVDVLFEWKEMKEKELHASAILTIINHMLPQFRLTDYVPNA